MAWYGRDYRYGRDPGYGRWSRYGGDYERGGFLGRGAFWDRNPAYGTGRGYGDRGWDRGYDRGFDRDRGFEWGRGDRMRFRAGEGGRDWDDRLREGWHDLKHGVRRAFGGGGYDRSSYGGRYYTPRYDRDWW